MSEIKTKIDFFSKDLKKAIGPGIYTVSVIDEKGKNGILYVGESVYVLARCASHLYQFKKHPDYFGFTEEQISNDKLTLKFELYRTADTKKERKQIETQLIKESEILLQDKINDHMKGLEDRIQSLKEFLD